MVAQRYNLNANQVFKWRRLLASLSAPPAPAGFVQVVVQAATVPGAGPATICPTSDDSVVEGLPATGRMESVRAADHRPIVARAINGSASTPVIAVLERR